METSLARVTKELLGHRRLPVVVAVLAVILMLPAFRAGLGMDDLIQRTIQLDPGQLPPRLRDTGFAMRSGTLPVVMSDLFGFRGEKEAIECARNYGLLPWWMRDGVKAALWRPLTAFTHWLAYRAFPDSAVPIHTHIIAWFPGVVFPGRDPSPGVFVHRLPSDLEERNVRDNAGIGSESRAELRPRSSSGLS